MTSLMMQARVGRRAQGTAMRRFMAAAAHVLAATLWGVVLPWSASGPAEAQAPLQVFACEPEWAALVRELAGDQAQVYVATHALQDPHQVQARPSLVAALRRAQLVVCTGAGLESGWLLLLLRQAANPGVQPGRPGYFEAASAVERLDVPSSVDRAQGDVHAAGNPHIQTDPGNIARVARALQERLASVDPSRAPAHAQRAADFLRRWDEASARWSAAAAPLRGTAVVVQHASFAYLHRWLGLQQVATLEPRPGIAPGTPHLSQVLAALRERPARLVLRAACDDPRPSQWLAGRTGLPLVVVPFTVGGSARAQDLFSLFDDTVAKLLAAAAAGATK